MASLSRKIKRAQIRKTQRTQSSFTLDRSLERLQNLGIGVGSALVFLTLPSIGSAADPGFTQSTQGKTTTYNQYVDKVFNNVPTYNIGIDETHRYNQPGASSIFVQRVMGGDYSSILGQLIANGQVWVMNPGGVLIGANAQINTAGFMATSLVMGEDDFFAGRYLLKQDGKDGFVINNGNITVNNGGYAILAGGSVVNNGYIQANMGEVVLASGRTMTMDFAGDGLINFAVNEKTAATITGPDGAELTSAVLNAGAIKADGGRVLLTGRAAANILDAVVNNTGIIEAKGVVERNGEIILTGGDEGVVKNSGTLDVSGMAAGQDGGAVIIQGAEAVHSGVVLANGAAEGTADGGTVKILGRDLAVFSENALIEARGGAEAGNGGFVEISGANVVLQGFADRRAPNGEAGMLLIDPDDIEINTVSTLAGYCLITPTQIDTQLNGGPLTITTAAPPAWGVPSGGDGAASDGGDIEIRAVVSDDSGFTLTLTAADQIRSTGAGDITLTKGGGLVLNAGNGGILTSGDLSAASITSNTTGSQTFIGTITSPILNLTVTGGGTPIQVQKYGGGAITASLNSGTLDLTSSGDVTVNSITGGTTITMSVTGKINDDGDAAADITAAAVNLTATTGIGDVGTLELSGVDTIDLTTTSGNIDISNFAGAATTINTALVTGAAGTITYAQSGGQTLNAATIQTNDGNITISNDAQITAGTTSIIAGGTGDVSITATAGDIVAGDIQASGDRITLTAAGAITDNNAGANNLTALEAVLTASSGGVDLDTTITSLEASAIGGSIDIANTGALTIGGLTAMTGVSTDLANNITLSSTADMTIGELISTATGAVTLTATGAGSDILTSGAGKDIAAGTINLNALNGAIGTGTAVEVDASVIVNADTSTGGGNISIDATADLPMGLFKAGAGTVTLNALAGSILDANDDTAASNIVAATATLTAQDEIGAFINFWEGANTGLNDALETNVTNLSATTTAADSRINISEQDGLAITALNPGQANKGWALISAVNDLDISAAWAGITTTGNDSLGFVSGGILTLPEAAINVGTGNLRFEGATVKDATDTTFQNTITAANFFVKTDETIQFNDLALSGYFDFLVGGAAKNLTAYATTLTVGDLNVDNKASASGNINLLGKTAGDTLTLETTLQATGAITIGGATANDTVETVNIKGVNVLGGTGLTFDANAVGNTNINLAVAPVELSAGTGNLNGANADLLTGTTNTTLTADGTISFNTIDSTGGNSLTFRPFSTGAGADIRVESPSAGEFNVTAATLYGIDNDFAEVIVGRTDGGALTIGASGAIDLVTATRTYDLTILAGSGAAPTIQNDLIYSTTAGTVVTLNVASGTVTQGAGAAIQGDSLLLKGGAAYTLTELTNDVNTIAATAAGDIQFYDADGLAVNSVSTVSSGAVDGITQVNNLTLRIDAGDAGAFTLAVNKAITNAASITLESGNVGAGDTIDINQNLTATAGITIQKAATVQIANVTLEAQGGDLSISTNVGGILLDGGAGTATLKTTGTATDNDVILGAVTHSGGENLTILSTGSVTMNGSINLSAATAGNLDISFDTDADAAAETLTVGQTLTVANLDITGGGLAGADVVDINTGITTSGYLTIDNTQQVQISNVTLEAQGGNLSITTNVGGILLDGGANNTTTLQTTTADNDVLLAPVTVATASINGEHLTVSSMKGVTLGSVDLNGGDLSVMVDSDNDVGVSTLAINNALTDVGNVTLQGGGAGDEIIDINAGITAGGFLTIQNAAQVQISNVTLEAQGGNLSITTNVTGILLDGGANNTTILQTTTAENNVLLAPVTVATASINGEHLTVSSMKDATFSTIDLNGGDLSITVDSNNTGGVVSTLAINNAITDVGNVTLKGGGAGDEIIDINAGITAAGFLTVQNVATVQISNVTLEAKGGDLSITTNVTGILLDGGANNTTILQTTTAENNVLLAPVTVATASTNGEHLTVSSMKDATFSTIDLNGGDLSITVDSNNTGGVVSTLAINNAITDVGNVTLQGGGAGDEIIDINAGITAAGFLTVQNAATVQISNVTLEAKGGDLSITTNVTGILLDGGANNTTILQTTTAENNVLLAPVTVATASTNGEHLTVSSMKDATFSTIDLNGGDLSITVDSNNTGGVVSILAINNAITDVGNVTLQGGGAGDEIIDINAGITAAGFLTVQNAATVQISNVTLEAQGGNLSISTNVGGILLDGGAGTATLKTTGTATDDDVILGPVTHTNGENLTILSTGTVTMNGSIDLSAGTDGNLDISFDTDADAVAETLTIGQTLTVGKLDITGGGAAGADVVDINQGITTTGYLNIDTTQQVKISNVTLDAQGGPLTISSNVGGILIDGGGATTTTLQTTSTDNNVVLAAVTSTANETLTINSTGGVLLQGGVDLTTVGSGTLNINLDTNGNGATNLNIDNDIDVGALNVAGTAATGMETVNLATNVDITTATGGISLAAAQNIGGIVLDGAGTNILTAGSDGNIVLAAVTTSPGPGNDAADLTLTAQGSITVSTIDLAKGGALANDGTLVMTVDSDNSDVESETLTINGGLTNIAALTLSGGFSASSDDIIAINANITTTAGGITIQKANDVQIDALANRTLTANGGDILVAANVNNVTLLGGTSTVTLDANGVESDASDADVILSSPVRDTTAANLAVTADGDVTLAAITLDAGAGTLSATADMNQNTTGSILNVGGIINVAGAVTLAGTADGGPYNDTVDINADVTSGAALIVKNGALVDLAAGVDLQGTSVAVSSNVTGISLTGASATTNTVTATAEGAGTLTLAPITAVNSPNLTLTANGGLTIGNTININGGILTATADGNSGSPADILAVNSIITAGTITLSGGADSDENIDINANVVSGAGGIVIQNTSDTDLGANLYSNGGTINLTDAGAITLDTVATVTIDSNYDGVDNNGAAGSVDATGVDISGAVNLVIDASSANAAGGPVTLATVGNGVDVTSLTVSTNGTTNGTLTLTGNIDTDGIVNFANAAAVVISDADGTVAINTVNGAGTIGYTVTFAAAGTLEDGAANGGTNALNVNVNGTITDGNVVLPEIIGAGDAIGTLQVTADTGTITLGAYNGVNTVYNTAGITYGSTVILTNNTTQNTKGGDFDASAATITGDGNGIWDLTINTTDGGAGAEGAIKLATINGSGGSYLNKLTLTGTDGLGGAPAVLTLNGSISLDHDGTEAADMVFTGGGDVIISSSLTIDTELDNSSNSGNVNLGTSNIYADATNYTLVIDTGTGPTAGNVTIGLVDDNVGAGKFLENLIISTNAATDGVVMLNGDIYLDHGTLSRIDGLIRLPADRIIDTAQTDGAGGSISLVQYSGNVSATANDVDLTINTSAQGLGAANGGDVTLGNFDASGGFFVEDVTITASPAGAGTAGNLILKGLIYIDGNTTPNAADFTFTGGDVKVNSTNARIDTEYTANNDPAGKIDLGSSRIYGTVSGGQLVLDTSDGGGQPAGNITFGAVDNGPDPGVTTYYLSSFTASGHGINTSAPGIVTPNGDIYVAGPVTLGGHVTLPGATLTISSNANGAGGTLDVSSFLFGELGGDVSATPANSTLNLQAGSGAVTLGKFNSNAGNFVNILNVSTTGSTTLMGDITLSDNGTATESQFNITGAGDVIVANSLTIDLSTNGAGGADGGSINFGGSNIVPSSWNRPDLTINTSNSLAGGQAGNVSNLNNVNMNIANNCFLGSLTINMNGDAGATGVTKDGTLSFQNATAVIEVTGSVLSQNDPTINIDGKLQMPATSLRMSTNGSTTNSWWNLDSGAIDIRDLIVNGPGSLTLTTSGDIGSGARSADAGNVHIGDLGVATALNNVTVDTRGTALPGTLYIHDANGDNLAQVNVSDAAGGKIDFQNAVNVVLMADTRLDTSDGTVSGGAIDFQHAGFTPNTISGSGGSWDLIIDTDGTTDGAVLMGVVSNAAGSYLDDLIIGPAASRAGDVTFTTGNNVTVTGGVLVNSSSDIYVNSVVSTNGLTGVNTLMADGWLQAADRAVDAIADGVDFSIHMRATKNITMSTAGEVNATGAGSNVELVDFVGGGVMSLSKVQADATVYLEAADRIDDINDGVSAVNNVTATTLKARAGNKIGEVSPSTVLLGPTDPIETIVSNLTVTTTNVAGGTEIAVDNTLAGTLTPVITIPAAGNNQVWIRNSQSLDVSGFAMNNLTDDYGFIADTTGTLTIQNTGATPINADLLNLQGAVDIVGLGGSVAGTADVVATSFLMKSGAVAGEDFNTDVTNFDGTITGAGGALTVEQVLTATATVFNITDIDGDKKSIETNAGDIFMYQQNKNEDLVVKGAGAAPSYSVDARGANITLEVDPVVGGTGTLRIENLANVTSNGADSVDTGALNIAGRVVVDGTVHATASRTINLTAPAADMIIGPEGKTGSGNLTLSPGAGFDVIVQDGGYIQVNAGVGAAGNLIVTNAADFDMQGANSYVRVDGGVDIGNGAFGAAPNSVTGNVNLNNVYIDFDGDGNGSGGATGLYVTTTLGNINLNGLIDANMTFGTYDNVVNLKATAGGIYDTANTGSPKIVGAYSLTASAATGIGELTDPIEIDARFVDGTVTGAGLINLANQPSGDVQVDFNTNGGNVYYSQQGKNLTAANFGDADSYSIFTNGGSVVIDPPVDITIAADISTGAGSVTLEATNNITFTTGDIITTTGNVRLLADEDLDGLGNVVFVAAVPTSENIRSTSGNIEAIGQTIALQNNAITTGGDVGLTAGRLSAASGAITSALDGTVDVTGSTGTLIANAGIFADTSAATIIAHQRNTGAIAINEASGVTLADVDTFNGAITIAAGGAMTATDVQSTAAQDITLTTTGAGNVTLGIVKTAGTGDVYVRVNSGNVLDDGDAGTTVMADNFTISNQAGTGATNGTVTVDTQVNTIDIRAGSTVDVDEADAVTLTRITTAANGIAVNSLAGNITIGLVTAATTVDINAENGALVNAGASNIDGTVITLTAGNGNIGAAGAGNAITVDGTVINANASQNNGSIWLTNSAGAFNLGFVNAGTGDITLTSIGAMLDANGAARNLQGTTANATLAGAFGDATDYIETELVTLNLTGATNVYVQDASGVTVNAGNASGALFVNASGDTTVTSTGAMSLGVINAGSGNVTITAGGNITDGSDADENIIGNNVTINLTAGSIGIATGATGVGKEAIETDIDNLTINDLDVTGVAITETKGISLENITVTGPVTITATNGTMTASIVNSSAAAAGAGAIRLEAANGDMRLNEINAGASAVTLISGGFIIENGNGDVGTDITGTTLTLTANGGGIGAGNPIEIDSTGVAFSATGGVGLKEMVGDLNIITTASAVGGINLSTVNGSISIGTSMTGGSVTLIANDTAAGSKNVTIDAPITAGGDVVITADNNINVNDDVTATGTVNLTATEGSITRDAVGDKISGTVLTMSATTATKTITASTNVYAVDAAAGAGVTINEDSDLTVININAGTGAAVVTAGAAGGDAAGVTAASINGVADITAGTSITVTAAGDITLETDSPTLSLTTNDAVGGLERNINVASLRAGTVTVSGSTTDGDFNVQTAQAMTVGAAGITAGTNGDVNLTTLSGNMSIGGVITATGDDVILISAGAINEATNDDATTNATDIAAGTVRLTASTGIGTTSRLDLDVPTVALATTNTGGINLRDVAATSTFSDVHTTGAGAIYLTTTGAAVLTDVDTANGGIGVTALGAVTATDVASLTDSAANDIYIQGTSIAAGIVNAGTAGAVTLDATTGAITDLAGDVTADVLTIDAATAITLTTNVNTITYASSPTTTTGNITITEKDAVVLANLVVVNGNISVTAGGQITATNVSTNSSGNDVTLTATAGDVLVNSVSTADVLTITAQAGAIEETTPDGTWDLYGATINLTAGNGGIGALGAIEINASVTTVVNANSSAQNGNIQLTSTVGNLPVGLVTAGTGTVTLIANDAATGSILESGADAGADIIGGTINLTAAGSIGAVATPIEIDASVALSAQSGGVAGEDIVLTDVVDDLPLGTVNAGLANVVLVANDSQGGSDAAAIVDAADGNTDITAANANLSALSGIGSGVMGATTDLDVNVTTLTAAVTSAGGINIDEADTLTVTSATVADGNVVIRAATGMAVTLVDADAAAGNAVHLRTTTGNLTLSSVFAAGNAKIEALAGAIVDGNAGTMNITADTLMMDAVTGIGTDADALETTVTTLAARTDSGDINIANTGALTIGTVSGLSGVTITDAAPNNNSGNDNITITATSPLTVDTAVANHDGGSIILAAQGSAATDDLSIYANITADGGNGSISLYAGDSVAMSNSTISATSTGAIVILASTNYAGGTPVNGTAAGSIMMGGSTVVSSEDGNINLRAGGNIGLRNVNANSDGDGILGNVTVAADWAGVGGGLSDNDGAITDQTSTESANITAGTAFLSAATGIGVDGNIDLNVTDVSATNSFSGAIRLNEVAAGGALNVTAATTLLGDIEITTEDGILTVVDNGVGAVVVSTTGSGKVTLTAGTAVVGTNDDLVINDGITAVNGAVTLTSKNNDVLFGANGDVTTTTGDIEVNAGTAGAGVITMADGTIFNAGSGTITLNGVGRVTLGQVTTTNSTGKAVYIESTTADIADGGDTGGSDIIANSTGAVTTLRAVTGIGNVAVAPAANGTLETTIYTIDAVNTNTGNIQIAETDALIINQARQLNLGGSGSSNNIDIRTTSGDLTVAANQAGVRIDNICSVGTIVLSAGNGNLAVNSGVASMLGNITLQADKNVTFSSASTVDSMSGNVAITADAAAGNNGYTVTMNNGAVVNAGSGTIAVSADGNILLGQLITTNATNTAVTLTTTSGAVTDNNGEDMNVIANSGRLVIDAATGVGSADALETKVSSLDIDNSTSGNIDIAETDAVTIVKAVQAAGGGNIRVVSDAGSITVADNGIAAAAISTQGAGTVTLTAKGTASDIALNDGITTVAGNIDVFADNDITMGVNGDITSTSGNVQVIADADARWAGAGGKVTMADGAVVNAGSGTITVGADGNVVIGSLQTTNSSDSAVSVTSTSGAILDGGDADVDIIAHSGKVTLNAFTGIGRTALAGELPGSPVVADPALEIETGRISADTTTGDINIDNALATFVTVSSLTTGSGDITFDQTGGGDIIFEIVSTGDGSATLTNTNLTNDPNIYVGDIFATERVDILTDGSILNDSNNADNAYTDITAPVANLRAYSGTIGVWNMPVQVDVGGALYIYAGGAQMEWLSANLQGRDVNVLQVDLVTTPQIPGMVLFNDVVPGANSSIGNGTAYYFDNAITNKFFQAAAQNTMSLANEIEPYALWLDVYGDALFAPYDDLINFIGTGVTPEEGELQMKLSKK